ncbi:MAG: hypothetical protein E7168_01135 [Firmicutes bacterium]|nr:hypothetical protein [Bacillota bacterium]
MGIFEEDYKIKEHQRKMLYDTFLLADLLWLNHCFSNHKYNNTTGDEVWQKALKKEKYTNVEKDKIINNAMNLLNIRYDLNVGENYKDKCKNLDFD